MHRMLPYVHCAQAEWCCTISGRCSAVCTACAHCVACGQHVCAHASQVWTPLDIVHGSMHIQTKGTEPCNIHANLPIFSKTPTGVPSAMEPFMQQGRIPAGRSAYSAARSIKELRATLRLPGSANSLIQRRCRGTETADNLHVLIRLFAAGCRCEAPDEATCL